MCGIVGYIGQENCKEILLKGLEKLEYRGYDSAGIALISSHGALVYKDKGRIENLRAVLDESVDAPVGIGHTRWATHGQPTRANAHPHKSTTQRFTLVHNGVIENDEILKHSQLEGVTFRSATDTEVIVQLVEHYVEEGMEVEVAFREALKQLIGSYALVMIDAKNPDLLYVAKNKSPLLVGVGDTFNCVASDAMAMLQVTDQFVELMDKEYVLLTKDKYEIKTLDGETVKRAPFTAEIDASDIEKGTYSHFMLKEIDEQPFVIRKMLAKYRGESGKLEVQSEVLDAIAASDRMYIIACGTSYHAGLVGKHLIESLAKIPVEVHVASEFSYNPPLLSERPIFLFISQSGETADSRACLVNTNKAGYPSITLTNVPGSTLSREADYTMLLHAGPEIAVASTKAYTAQLAALSILAYCLAEKKEIALDFDLLKELSIVATALEALCDQKSEFEDMAREFLETTRNCFFIGRGLDYYVCLEGALKLKEISYIQAEGFAGGELKHGTIALIEEGTPVISLVTQKNVALNIRGNVKEVQARGANPCIISMKGMETDGDRFVLPAVHPILTSLVTVVPLQIISYYAALHRGCDVDKPRNLAKSVTVE